MYLRECRLAFVPNPSDKMPSGAARLVGFVELGVSRAQQGPLASHTA